MKQVSFLKSLIASACIGVALVFGQVDVILESLQAVPRCLLDPKAL